MGVLAGAGKIFTSVINIRVDHWLGASYIKNSVGQTIANTKTMFIPERADRQESFSDALQRLNITEADLKTRESEFLRLFAVHFLLAIGLFCYALFLFYSGNWGGGCMTLCLVLYPLALAFRFHFWLFQIRQRKLGCTIKEWWNNQ